MSPTKLATTIIDAIKFEGRLTEEGCNQIAKNILSCWVTSPASTYYTTPNQFLIAMLKRVQHPTGREGLSWVMTALAVHVEDEK
jgi:hypothetical protein